MDKSSIKKTIKPLIKECLTEILMEEGLIKLVKENIQKESKQFVRPQQEEAYDLKEKQFIQKNQPNKKISLQEAKQKMLKEIGMSGFDPFAGSIPLSDDSSSQEDHELNESSSQKKLMPGIQGSGVDISKLMSANKNAWNFFNDAMGNSEKEE